MTSNAYFVLMTSDTLLEKRFKATRFEPIEQKRQTTTQTAGGLSIVSGVPLPIHQITVRTSDEVVDSIYGTIHDLKTFFRLNNPSAVPSSTITYTSFDGTQYYIKMMGDFNPQPLTTIVNGPHAHFVCAISLLLVSTIES